MCPQNKIVFSKNLKEYMNRSGRNRNQMVNDLGVSYSTLTDWINGKKYPRIDKIDMLAEYFGISKSDLIEDFEEIKKDNDRLAAIIVKLRTNKELLDVAEKLILLDKTKLNSLSKLLDTFI